MCCGGGGGDNNNDRRYIYIYNIGSVERDRQKKEVGGGGGDVRVHSDNYPAYKYFLLLRLFFFFFSWHKFVFCVLCFVCVLWLERETENTTYIQERLKRRKYVMSNFLV